MEKATTTGTAKTLAEIDRLHNYLLTFFQNEEKQKNSPSYTNKNL
jgi:hypothetical protein